MSAASFERLREAVFADPELTARLAGADMPEFRDAVIAAANERNLTVTPADLDRAIEEGQRAWSLRWMR